MIIIPDTMHSLSQAPIFSVQGTQSMFDLSEKQDNQLNYQSFIDIKV